MAGWDVAGAASKVSNLMLMGVSMGVSVGRWATSAAVNVLILNFYARRFING